MRVRVKYFASLREQLGSDGVELDLDEAATVADVWKLATNLSAPENLLSSRNLKYAEWDESVEEGDEVAFFPPVTGG